MNNTISPRVLRVQDNPFFKNIDAICEAVGIPINRVSTELKI